MRPASIALCSLISVSQIMLFPTLRARAAAAVGCPQDMVTVRGFCIDRYEAASVDKRSGAALSPYYAPDARLVEAVYQQWQMERRSVGSESAREFALPELPAVQKASRDYQPQAVSRPGQVPQGYLSYPLAKAMCERAGKRLCTESEWVMACKGESGRKFPYGEQFEQGRCNVHRAVHPAQVLHGNASYGHRDPRLNLVSEAAIGPLLRVTGATATCASRWGSERIFDMVGNLDEWVEEQVFLGGFYARSTREGCESKVSSHAAAYYDYSTGTRCCRNAD
ncbi:MAG: SUMF1/EgtB/PvdO family nonheme iron enzyme [Polyangiaceae bacterium]